MVLKRLLPFTVFLVLSGVLYAPTLSFELVYLDDNVWILDYGWLLQDWRQAARFFVSPDFISRIFYRPILNLSFLLDAHSPLPGNLAYRVTNIILHAACSGLVYRLFICLKYNRPAAWTAGLIFAVHPASTAAVAWIPGRTDSLLAFFTLLAVTEYIAFARGGPTSPGGRAPAFSRAGTHMLFFVLALLTKETAVVIPAVCFAYSLCEGRAGLGKPRQLLMAVGWAVTLAGFFILRNAVIPDENRVGWSEAAGSVLRNSPALVSYLGKVIFPAGQSVLPHRPDMTLAWGQAALAGLVIGCAAFGRKSGKRICFGAAWFLLFLAPALVISFLKHEYRLYLPMIGIGVILASWTEVPALARRGSFAGVIAGIIITGFAAKTLVFSRNYRDRFAFWESAVKSSPTLPLARRNRAAMYHLEGRLDQAEAGYRKALELNPGEKMANNNLGLIYQNRGDAKSAEFYYQKEIAVNPFYDDVYYNYGILKYQGGERRQAQALWERAVEVNPRYVPAWHSLLALALEEGRRDDARRYARLMRAGGMAVPFGETDFRQEE
jgi:hypothetical protein